MKSILELAEQLGQAISDSPQADAMRKARQALEAEEGLMQTLNDYQEQADKVGRLEQENKPVEVDDKHKLRRLHDTLVSSEAFKAFNAAQMDYADLMRQVNGALRSKLESVEGAPG